MSTKKIIIGVLILLLILIAFVIIKTELYKFGSTQVINKSDKIVNTTPSDKALRNFAGGIRIPTISNEPYNETNFKPFNEFKSYLKETYPKVYEVMETDSVNTYGLIYRWKGKNSDLKPILFLSHYDVVPVAGYNPQDELSSPIIFQPLDRPLPPIEAYATKWDYPPFSGAVVNGRIYGRGTLDMKVLLFSLMEGAEALITDGFQPERDIWFAFGQDEEVSGREGAVKIADYFKAKELSFDAVYDEGGIVAAPESAIEAIKKPVALVGIGEKGFLTLELTIKGIGGHSSMPPAKSSLVYAAEIINKLNTDQFPARLISPISAFLNNVGGEMNFTSRVAIANQWLLKPILLNVLAKSPASNALIRTTTAITMAKGSDAPNVLASDAKVTVNFRILPGDSVEGVLNHVREICKNYEVDIRTVSQREASGISPTNVRGYQIIPELISQLYPEAIVTPYISIGGTDAYKYQIVSDHIYRLLPFELNAYEQRTIHNENEYISIENFGRVQWYFKELMMTY